MDRGVTAPSLGAAFAADPGNAVHLDRLADWHAAQGHLDKAVVCARCAHTVAPSVERRGRLAVFLFNAGQLAEARTEAEAARSCLDGLMVLGLLALAQGRAAEAVEMLRAAAAQAPLRADLKAHLGNALRHLGDWNGAEAVYRQALAVNASNDRVAHELGLVLLTQGRLAEGWDHYRRRFLTRRPTPPRQKLPARLDGRRVFVEGEQGLGDELFLLRFVALLAERGAQVVCRPAAKLASLVARLSFVHRVADADEAAVGDHVVFLGDLPYLLDADHALPSIRLSPVDGRVAEMRQRLAAFGPPPYVGATWRAGIAALGRLSKAVAAEGVAQVLRTVDCRVVILQRQPQDGEVAAFAAALGRDVLDLSGVNDDLEGMLALLAALHGQVAVSNTNIHLAAALGKKAHVLVPHPAEFRWQVEGTHSPWFPDMAVYRQQADGNWRPALDALRQDLGGVPSHAADPRILARAVHARDAGRLDEAEALCRQCLDQRPDDSGALRLLAVVLLMANRTAEAVAPLDRLADLQPTAENLRFLGSALLRSGQAGRAAEVLDRAAPMAPADAALAEARAGALLEVGRYAEAVEVARNLPHNANARFIEGSALHLLGDYAAAVTVLRRLLADHPNHSHALNSLAQALYAQGEMAEAEQSWRRSLKADAGNDRARAGLGLMCLAQGRFAEGWDLTRWRDSARLRPGLPTRKLPDRLDGYDALVVREQGLGDELFLMRFVERLAARGCRVAYVTNPKLAPLLTGLPFLAQVEVGEAEINADLVVWPGDLPWLLDEPGPFPSVRLTPRPERVAEMRRILADFGPPPYVGLTWRAGISGFNLLSKSVPLPDFAAALQGADFRPVVLQRAPQGGEVRALHDGLRRPVLDMSALNDDLEGMLALLSALDDQVAVSNTNIHLAAALGKTARLLLPDPPEYRWMAAGETSPWFPGFTLYRHDRTQGWGPALRRLEYGLKAL